MERRVEARLEEGEEEVEEIDRVGVCARTRSTSVQVGRGSIIRTAYCENFVRTRVHSRRMVQRTNIPLKGKRKMQE